MKKRLFVAIDLPANWKQALIKWQEQYNSLVGIKWVPEENLHITLAFLGDIAGREINNLKQSLAEMVSRNQLGFNLEISAKGVSWAPSERRARMIWLNFITNALYVSWVNQVWQAAGRWVEPKILASRHSPQAHVTLARLKRPGLFKLIQPNLPAKSFQTNKFLLVQSELTVNRPYYTTIAEFY